MADDSHHDTERTTNSATTHQGGPTWIDMLEELFDTAVDRQAELECDLEDVEVELPLQMGPEPDTAHWKIDGTLRFRLDGIGGPLAEWLRWRDDQQRQQQHQQSSIQPANSEQPDSSRS